MAQEAPKEPTMEEILASIRKIISEDDAPPPPTQEPAPLRIEPEDIAVTDDAFDAADDMVLEDEAPSDPEPARPSLSFEDLVADVADKSAEPMIAERLDEAMGRLDETERVSADDVASVFETEPFEPEDFEAATFDEGDNPAEEELPPPPLADTAVIEAEPAPVAAIEPDPFPVAPAAISNPSVPNPPAYEPEEPSMAQTASSVSLTEEKTADAAAGALARLVSKMDMGSENTLEGIVRELLKPMLKEWLDQNLPQIVEEKVEAEVQRIARLAR